MDFSLSEDQQTLRKEIIRFAQKELNDFVIAENPVHAQHVASRNNPIVEDAKAN